MHRLDVLCALTLVNAVFDHVVQRVHGFVENIASGLSQSEQQEKVMHKT